MARLISFLCISLCSGLFSSLSSGVIWSQHKGDKIDAAPVQRNCGAYQNKYAATYHPADRPTDSSERRGEIYRTCLHLVTAKISVVPFALPHVVTQKNSRDPISRLSKYLLKSITPALCGWNKKSFGLGYFSEILSSARPAVLFRHTWSSAVMI